MAQQLCACICGGGRVDFVLWLRLGGGLLLRFRRRRFRLRRVGGIEDGGVSLLEGVAHRPLAADGPAHGGEGLLEVRIPPDKLPGGVRQTADRLRKQQLGCYQQNKNRAADHQPQRNLPAPVPPGPDAPELLGPAIVRVGC